MDLQKTHGVFSWNELTTPDPEAASAFYAKLFGWTVQTMDMGEAGTYHLAQLGARPVAGMMFPPPDAPDAPLGWASYITVDDVDKSLAQALSMGASPAMPAMDVKGVGRMAGFVDPQGAMINIIKYCEP